MMKTYSPLLLFMLLICSSKVYAQDFKPQADSLTAEEIIVLEGAVMKSMFGARYYADSFSSVKDKVSASKWFLKIDPYLFLWSGGKGNNIEKIYTRFNLTDSAKNIYKDIYNKAYNEPKTEDYILFEKFREEDQLYRKIVEKCADSSACAKARRLWHKTDSTHFDYLYNYTLEKGWPSIKNGGLFAALIALHDGERADYYIPIIKDAIKRGELSLTPLMLMLAKKRDKLTYDDLRTKLDTSFKRTFVVKALLNHTLPKNVDRIKSVISKYCSYDFELMLVYEFQQGTHSYRDWFRNKGSYTYDYNGKYIEGFYKMLEPSCPDKVKKQPIRILYLPTERMRDRIVLHIVVNN